jgi:hypothetical protein
MPRTQPVPRTRDTLLGEEARRAVHHVVEGRSPPPFLPIA